MTTKEQAFLRDLRRVMRDHKVELSADTFGDFDECPAFIGPSIHVHVDKDLADDLEDQGGNRDEV
jgi:hypothetical protein